MAWVLAGDGLRVVSDTEDVSIPTTSTSTLLVERRPGYALVRHLRMYHFEGVLGRAPAGTYTADMEGVPVQVEGCDPSLSAWTEDTTGTVESYLSYVEDYDHFAGDDVTELGVVSIDSTREDVAFQTQVPTRKQNMEWEVVVLDPTGAETIETLTLEVVYKDPCVVELPNGDGWLMVLSRYRMDPDRASSMSPGLSLGDIVAWWSDTPDFRGEAVVGPFLLVDSLNAWPSTAEIPLRLWLGTATAAVVEEGGTRWLMVYYTVEPNALGDADPYLDVIGGAAYAELLADFTPGVAAKAINYNALMLRIRAEYVRGEPTLTREDSVSHLSLSYFPEDYYGFSDIDGELLGAIRVWLFEASPGYPRRVRAFTSVYSDDDEGGGGAPQWVDPAAAVCDDHLSLYLAALLSPDEKEAERSGAIVIYSAAESDTGMGSGHGLWRVRAVRDGLLLHDADTDSLTIATFGKDFLAAPLEEDEDGYLHSPDQIAEGEAGVGWKDPDPVQLVTGDWAVYGQDNSSADAPLSLFLGDSDDGCSTAADLYSTLRLPRLASFKPTSPDRPVVVLGHTPSGRLSSFRRTRRTARPFGPMR